MPARVHAAGRRTVPTNSTPNSTLKLDVEPITFQQLWDNYVTGNPHVDETGAYANQCAIRMSATLHRVGIEMKSFSAKVVRPSPGKPSIGRILLNGKPTATRADEMAAWLSLKPFAGLPAKPESITGTDWEVKVRDRTGIIAFLGYWTRDGESDDSASGGHIDLWNGSRLTISSPLNSIATIGRRLGFNSIASGLRFGYSDLRRSKEILFWEIK